MTAGHHDHPLSPATQVVALGRPGRDPGAPLNVSPTFTSTYIADGPVNYARGGNPTWTALEEAVGALEGGDALAFASGMAAVSAVLSLVPAGGTVLAPFAAYNGVVVALTEAAEAGRLTVRWIDVTDDEGVRAALPGADLLWLESPTNPLLDVADLDGLVRAAHEAGALAAVDNTFATPLLQQPLRSGAEVVVHSATKYLSGHSDVILGLTVTRPDLTQVQARLARHRQLGGGIAGPMEAWLVLRGLRTLSVRLERACANAAELASRLGGHERVTRVRYPGFGAIVSIEVSGGAKGAEQVATSTRLWSHSTSLGGVESQLERRRRQPGEPESTPVDLLRLSVGVEDVEDLWRDLDRALRS
ncbi:PLP-dependent transferase [Marihabitans asiaticum]|uniref:homocysteine desulfhydrase n=1 Tax=Marihabitans asiaticum TaxID=415218 RepID=A0A560W9I7_9MICO|nr:PLP-dependent transferase [Marihabitans asiaticum]TWD14293.1 cystathionine gamma-synthase [Marihabitans asiaticum]